MSAACGALRKSQEGEMSEATDNVAHGHLVQPEYLRFESKLKEVLHDLLKHGFGQVVIRISTQKEHKRTIVIECGRSYQYTVHLSETRD